MTTTAGDGSRRAGDSEDTLNDRPHECARLRVVPHTSAALAFWAAFDFTSGESSACPDATECERRSPS
jgi:hypothetical protein